MTTQTIYRECTDGPRLFPNYEMQVDFEVERGVVYPQSVMVRVADAAWVPVGPNGYDRAAIVTMCLDHLKAGPA